MDIDKIGKLSKTFFKAGDFTARHIVDLQFHGSGNNSNKPRSHLYCYDVFDKTTHITKIAASISSKDNIILANNNRDSVNIMAEVNKENLSEAKGSAFVYIEPRDFDKVIDSLNTCIAWLCDEEYEKLFTVDANGNTVGVSNNEEVTVSRFRSGWIMFKPAVVFDKNGAGYQGIYIKCDRGILASLTGTEFKEFSNYMMEIMKNFYSCSLSLYTAGLTALMFNKN